MITFRACLLCIGFALGAPGPVAPAAPARPASASQPVPPGAIDVYPLLDAPAEETAEHLQQQGALERAIGAATDGLDRAQAHLALGNWLLAAPTARPATRWLIGLDRESDREVILGSAKAAGEHLALARELLDVKEEPSAAEGGTDSASSPLKRRANHPRRRELADVADTLEPFADLFAALALREQPEAFRSACGEAALRLAEAREADDESVAACARLWQSFGWAQAGRPKRALISLPGVLTPPERVPYDLLSRMLRCRLLADAGQHAAATALNLQMRGACPRWFRTRGNRGRMADRCARLLVLQQCAIGNAWLKALEAEGTPAARERLQALLAAAGQALLVDDESAALYHLDPAVPILTTAPEGPPEPPATAPANPSAPANGPATGPGTSDHPTTDTSVAP